MELASCFVPHISTRTSNAEMSDEDKTLHLSNQPPKFLSISTPFRCCESLSSHLVAWTSRSFTHSPIFPVRCKITIHLYSHLLWAGISQAIYFNRLYWNRSPRSGHWLKGEFQRKHKIFRSDLPLPRTYGSSYVNLAESLTFNPLRARVHRSAHKPVLHRHQHPLTCWIVWRSSGTSCATSH